MQRDVGGGMVCVEGGRGRIAWMKTRIWFQHPPSPPSSFVSLRIPCSFNPLSSFYSFEFLLTLCCIVQVAHERGWHYSLWGQKWGEGWGSRWDENFWKMLRMFEIEMILCACLASWRMFEIEMILCACLASCTIWYHYQWLYIHLDNAVHTQMPGQAWRVMALDNWLSGWPDCVKRVYVVFLLGVKISNRERMMHGIIMTSLHSDDTFWSVWCFCCCQWWRNRCLSQFSPRKICPLSFQ